MDGERLAPPAEGRLLVRNSPIGKLGVKRMKEMVTLNGREMPVTEAAKALCQATTYSTYLMEASNLRRPVEIMARDLPTDGRRPRRFTCLTTGTELFVSAKSLADMELEDLRLTEVDK